MHLLITDHSVKQQILHHNLEIVKRIKWIQQIVWKQFVKQNLMLKKVQIS